MDIDDRIQDYMDGLMSEADRNAFEADLKVDEVLRKKFDQYVTAKEVAKGLLEIDLKETLDKAKTGSKQKPRIIRKWMYIAAMLVPLVALLFYIKISSDDPDPGIFADVYTEPLWPVTRNMDNDTLAIAISSFLENGEVENAKNLITEYNGAESMMKDYWIAEMYLRPGGDFDSVDAYLPVFPEDHIKKEREEMIREWLAKYKN